MLGNATSTGKGRRKFGAFAEPCGHKHKSPVAKAQCLADQKERVQRIAWRNLPSGRQGESKE